MAGRRQSGLPVGQVLTLAFGFLLASVMIFMFGLWVGRDLAQQRIEQDRQILHEPIEGSVPSGTVIFDATATPTQRIAVDAARPTRPRLFAPTATRTKTVAPTQTRRPTKTRTVAPPVRRSRSTPTAAKRVQRDVRPGSVYTVQATATNDQVQALVLARGLRGKGYDAYTVQTDVAGVTWYRVQIGKFASKAEAEATAQRLRGEGLEAAFVDQLR